MGNTLKKLKLIDNLKTELEISKNDFHKKLNKIIDDGSSNFISDFFDLFSKSKNEYKGYVDFSNFKIVRKKRLFDMGFSFPTIKGEIEQKGERILINSEINAFKGVFVFFIFFVLLFYTFTIFAMFFLSSKDNNGEAFIAIPLILIHACFMLGIPYFILRRSVKRFKYDFERELFYLTKNDFTENYEKKRNQ